jgi:hypothetical protein
MLSFPRSSGQLLLAADPRVRPRSPRNSTSGSSCCVASGSTRGRSNSKMAWASCRRLSQCCTDGPARWDRRPAVLLGSLTESGSPSEPTDVALGSAPCPKWHHARGASLSAMTATKPWEHKLIESPDWSMTTVVTTSSSPRTLHSKTARVSSLRCAKERPVRVRSPTRGLSWARPHLAWVRGRNRASPRAVSRGSSSPRPPLISTVRPRWRASHSVPRTRTCPHSTERSPDIAHP